MALCSLSISTRLRSDQSEVAEKQRRQENLGSLTRNFGNDVQERELNRERRPDFGSGPPPLLLVYFDLRGS
jgi:hypothetical protein